MKEKHYKDYTLDEKIIYAKGWNAAIEAATETAKINQYKNPYNMLKEIRKLDKSIQAYDD